MIRTLSSFSPLWLPISWFFWADSLSELRRSKCAKIYKCLVVHKVDSSRCGKGEGVRMSESYDRLLESNQVQDQIF